VKYLKLYLVPIFNLYNSQFLKMKTRKLSMSFPQNLPKEIGNHVILLIFNRNFLKALTNQVMLIKLKLPYCLQIFTKLNKMILIESFKQNNYFKIIKHNTLLLKPKKLPSQLLSDF